MQFETCSFHGFEKNVIVVATKDSSVLAIESDTGNTLGSGLVGPTKPSKALFMQVLGNSLLIYLVTSSCVSHPTRGKYGTVLSLSWSMIFMFIS